MIAHPDAPIAALDQNAVRAMFAMRKRTWPDGSAVEVFVLPNRHPIHADFAKKCLGVYPHQLQLAWDRALFSGMGEAPHRVRTQEEMYQRLSATPGALGYLERDYLDDTLTVIPHE
ncbi:hypothetical protein ACGK9R_07815 [Halomonas sp. HNIBRBA4712]|uniref:hypothetical protein n=1 Tax=Halomonas sp. HNIBRBA4712 TaxID=3373087 RepID=UPI0037462DD1